MAIYGANKVHSTATTASGKAITLFMDHISGLIPPVNDSGTWMRTLPALLNNSITKWLNKWIEEFRI